MFAVLDCGTTNSRVYLVDDDRIIASGDKKVGVRDTSITGSKETLRNGVRDLFFQVVAESGVPDSKVRFVIASGMITSEIGLLELPHLVAPVGAHDLAANIVKSEDPDVLPIGRPVYFIRGIRNDYSADAGVTDLRIIDFMRGEEVQCLGALELFDVAPPCNIVALSSHTKVMYINAEGRIAASNTTISGQFYEALLGSTNIGKSITPIEGEQAGGYDFETLVAVARECVEHAGLGRTMLMPRFMQVLLKTNGAERNTFINAAIAYDDLKAFHEMRDRGLGGDVYVLYGPKARCELYQYMLKKEFGEKLAVKCVWDKEEIARLTVQGAIHVANDVLANQ